MKLREWSEMSRSDKACYIIIPTVCLVIVIILVVVVPVILVTQPA